MARHPNVAKVELVAYSLGDLCSQVVFVGGCAVDLLITDPAAAPARVTYDVDLVAQVAAVPDYYALEADFCRVGFKRDQSDGAPICRWRLGALEVDLMPTESAILGFANRWYPLAVQTAQRVSLPNGLVIQLISAPLFVATKFEAFATRGRKDLLGSHDLEDIINVADGRPELSAEIDQAPLEVRQYLSVQCSELLTTSGFLDVLPGMIFPDESLDGRVRYVVDVIKQVAAFS